MQAMRVKPDKGISYPSIAPISDELCRPLWSVMITSYKRTEYIECAIKSVLDQDIGENEIQIEVVDDCSPNYNDIEAIVREVGQGRVLFYRQPKNIGIYSNWNTCIRRARGYWIHILSDDDQILPGFYSAYRHYIESHECMAVLGQSIYINDAGQWMSISAPLQEKDGLLINAHLVLAKGNPINTPGIIVARKAYEKVGGFTNDLSFTPDWEMWTRLATTFEITYVNRPYCLFRIHSISETSKLEITGESVIDSLNATSIIQSRLIDPSERNNVRLYVNRWLSSRSYYLSNQFANIGYRRSAILHAFWSFQLTPSLHSFRNILSTFLKVLRFNFKNIRRL